MVLRFVGGESSSSDSCIDTACGLCLRGDVLGGLSYSATRLGAIAIWNNGTITNVRVRLMGSELKQTPSYLFFIHFLLNSSNGLQTPSYLFFIHFLLNSSNGLLWLVFYLAIESHETSECCPLFSLLELCLFVNFSWQSFHPDKSLMRFSVALFNILMISDFLCPIVREKHPFLLSSMILYLYSHISMYSSSNLISHPGSSSKAP